MSRFVLALDQGTTSTRAILFDPQSWRPAHTAQLPLTQHYPEPGRVEHDAEEIWRASVQVCREAIDAAGGPRAVAAIGLTNQRETTVLWDRRSGEVLHRAIVWQDRRTAEVCERMRADGREAEVQARAGLVLDPYFSATKIAWLLDHVPDGRARAARGDLAAGTIDSFLLWRLTGGEAHRTDATNASRTALLNLETLAWDPALAALFDVPPAVLPDVLPCTAPFGATTASLFGRPIPITGVAGDQQAALVGHGALTPGAVKATFGTGCFLMSHAGARPVASRSRLLATPAYVLGTERAYALEGSIFSAGATVQWLKEGLGVISASRESEALAASLPDNGGVYMVPGFAGLGAPWWNAEARGTITGLTRDSTAAHLVRAGLEALAYQTNDLLDCLVGDGAPKPAVLKVDGGVTANAFAMQFLADICALPVERPAFQELTALGAARLAALGCGVTASLDATPTDTPARWLPRLNPGLRQKLLSGWTQAVRAALAAAQP